MTITTRIENSAEDQAFVRRLVLDSLTLELGAAAWPQPMRDHLLETQYSARRSSARAANAQSSIILLDGVPAGWICRVDAGEAIRISEMMVLPEHRGQGVATAAILDALDAAGDRPVRLNVNVSNGVAIRLYERLGFRRTGGDEVQHAMEYRR